MIRLYDYWRPSASYRVRIALGLAELNWDTQVVNLLDGAHRSAAHLHRNPQGLVPAIELDGHVFTQSLAIIEYLDETRSLSLLPKDPVAKAHVRTLSYAIAMDIHPVCNLNVVRHAVDQSRGALKTQDWMQHFITTGLTAYEQMLGNGSYSFQDSVTLADICLMPQIYNADRWGINLTGLPKTRQIAERLSGIPAFAQAHPDKSPQ